MFQGEIYQTFPWQLSPEEREDLPGYRTGYRNYSSSDNALWKQGIRQALNTSSCFVKIEGDTWNNLWKIKPIEELCEMCRYSKPSRAGSVVQVQDSAGKGDGVIGVIRETQTSSGTRLVFSSKASSSVKSLEETGATQPIEHVKVEEGQGDFVEVDYHRSVMKLLVQKQRVSNTGLTIEEIFSAHFEDPLRSSQDTSAKAPWRNEIRRAIETGSCFQRIHDKWFFGPHNELCKDCKQFVSLHW